MNRPSWDTNVVLFVQDLVLLALGLSHTVSILSDVAVDAETAIDVTVVDLVASAGGSSGACTVDSDVVVLADAGVG